MLEKYNFPDKDDPQFADKMVDLVNQLFDVANSPIKNFIPISPPEGTKQQGDIWFDSSDEKLKVNTSTGVKILKYE